MKLGWVNVDAMLEQIDLEQFVRWNDYSEIEPWDETRADYRAAQIEACVVNLFRRSGSSAYPVKDFVLPFGYQADGGRTYHQDEDQQWAMLLRHAELGLEASKRGL